MKREDLEQLRALKQELDTLRERYLRLPLSEEVGDTYGDYRTGRKVVKVMHGISTARNSELKEKINIKTKAVEKAIFELEDFLDAVPDAEIRDIFRLYYAEGLSQQEVGKAKGYSRQAIGYKIDSFWADN